MQSVIAYNSCATCICYPVSNAPERASLCRCVLLFDAFAMNEVAISGRVLPALFASAKVDVPHAAGEMLGNGSPQEAADKGSQAVIGVPLGDTASIRAGRFMDPPTVAVRGAKRDVETSVAKQPIRESVTPAPASHLHLGKAHTQGRSRKRQQVHEGKGFSILECI